MSIIKQDFGSFQDMATQHMLAPILQNLVNDTGAVMPVNSYFIFNNKLYKVTTAIASGAIIVIGTTSGCNANYANTIMEEVFNNTIKNVYLAYITTPIDELTASNVRGVVISKESVDSVIPEGYIPLLYLYRATSLPYNAGGPDVVPYVFVSSYKSNGTFDISIVNRNTSRGYTNFNIIGYIICVKK